MYKLLHCKALIIALNVTIISCHSLRILICGLFILLLVEKGLQFGHEKKNWRENVERIAGALRRALRFSTGNGNVCSEIVNLFHSAGRCGVNYNGVGL